LRENIGSLKNFKLRFEQIIRQEQLIEERFESRSRDKGDKDFGKDSDLS